jgi:tRNA threonylcarbamoyladenosine biosynthesis protein TsaB
MSGVPTLALDTSTSCLSVAVLKDGSLACEINLTVKAGHSGMILPVIDQALERSALSRHEIDLVSVGIGPGSFTGLRIGIATAKGLALALGCPLAGIPTLDAIARGALPSPMQIMPVLDAKKGEVFCALYSFSGVRTTDFMNVKPHEIAALAGADTLFLGNGCSLYRDLLKDRLGGHYHEGSTHLWHPRAFLIGLMALELHPEDLPGDVLPLYVRASDATLILEKKDLKG